MQQLNIHNKNFETINTPPPRRVGADFPILTKLSESYKLWHSYFNNLPRHTKFTLGTKIDDLFTDCLELSLTAGYAKKEEKKQSILKLSDKFDVLKFFIQLLWEIGGLNNKKYSDLSQQLAMIGKMIGGWLNPPKEKPASNSTGN